MVEFAYNNKVQTSTKVLLFKTNNRRDLCIGFEMRKKGKFEKVKEFAMRKKRKFERAKEFATRMKEVLQKPSCKLV